VTSSSPVKVVLLYTYSGYEATITLTVVPGLTTRLISFLQSLVPYLRRKYPLLTERDERVRFAKVTEGDRRGSTIYPYWPGRI